MTNETDAEQRAANERLSDAYREAVGSVMSARTLYDKACAANGTESWPAMQAQEYLSREISNRNKLREAYDLVLDQQARR